MAIYLQFEGIDGNVTATGHEKWIQLGSVNFGLGRRIAGTSPGKQSNREASTPAFGEVNVSKDVDECSPLLFSEACVGKAKKVTIHFCETGASQLEPFLEYVLSDVLISSYSVRSGTSGSHPNETLSFNYNKIEVKYIPFKGTHDAGSPVPAGYDLSTGKTV
jgi:type VI secretion system secreted protein Hcp